MGTKKKYDLNDDIVLSSKKISWYYAPVFAAFWALLYLCIVHPAVNHLPTPITEGDETMDKYSNSFIAERAERALFELAGLGPKVLGSAENEDGAVQFLLREIAKIEAQASDSFEFETDVQVVTGNVTHLSILKMYRGLQNVVVKLQNKGATNQNYLLINTHFDSVPKSPGAGDAAALVVVMLEVMRVISKSKDHFEHPMIFLFNGAEENGLQASHAFITQHKWASNCKALINLDSAGNSGREILFQSGPNHGWLMKYYTRVPHPFASTMGEEMFQAGLIPSDTDFRMFRDYGGVPGLDMAYIFNGYIYHTKFDKPSMVGRDSLQNTGDNVLTLTRGLANAEELDNPSAYEDDHVVFYDYLGWFVISYSETASIIINSVVSFAALVGIGLSIFFMTRHSGLGWRAMSRRCSTTFVVHLISIGLSMGIALLVAFFMDAVGRSMSWFSQTWLIFGLYFCPVFFGLTVLPARYLERHKDRGLSLNYSIQLYMHAHCICLIVFTVVMTGIGVRSAFMSMIAVFFDMVALYINLLTRWHKKPYLFAMVVIICQVMPFFYFTYITEATYDTLIPMLARIRTTSNPDLQIAAIAILMSLLFAGFIMPLFMFFRKTRTLVLGFACICLVFIILAVTPLGFPFQAEVAPQRMNMIHVHRILHSQNQGIRINETGIMVRPEDRRTNDTYDYIKSLGEPMNVNEFCSSEMLCGLPVFAHRWHRSRQQTYWIPIDELPDIPDAYPELTLVSTVDLETTPSRKRFTFSLTGPDHMDMYLQPKSESHIVDWSFEDTMLSEQWQPPFYVYLSSGNDTEPLEFFVEVELGRGATISAQCLEIGIGGNWIHETPAESNTFQDYIKSFPDYVHIDGWLGTYESWIF